jgi:hypothetical protein
MHFFKRVPVVLLALALPLAACSDDSSTDAQQAALAQQDALQILGELMAALYGGMSGSNGLAAASNGASDPFNDTAQCSAGGTISVTGNFTDNLDANGSGTSSGSFTETPNGCKVTTSHGQFTVNGDPNLTGSWSMQYANWSPVGDMTYTLKGGFKFAGPSTGSCAIDITSKTNTSTFTGTVTGKVCGQSVNQTF